MGPVVTACMRFKGRLVARHVLIGLDEAILPLKSGCHELWFSLCFVFRCFVFSVLFQETLTSTAERVWEPNNFRAGYVDVTLLLVPQFAS